MHEASIFLSRFWLFELGTFSKNLVAQNFFKWGKKGKEKKHLKCFYLLFFSSYLCVCVYRFVLYFFFQVLEAAILVAKSIQVSALM